MSELASRAVVKEWCEHISHAAHAGAHLAIEGFQSKAFLRGLSRESSHHEPLQILSTRSLSGIIAYEPSELYVQAHAGTPLSEIEQMLDLQGQCLPFEPPRLPTELHPLGVASLGGMVASGLAGPARVSMGGVREHVLGLGLINGLGEHMLFGGQVIKNVAGYDVSRLLTGSMGRLGVITEVSLKVLPKAASELTFKVNTSARTSIQLLAQWGSKPLALNASAWSNEASDGIGGGTLMVRLKGALAATQSSLALMLQTLADANIPASDVQVMDTPEEATTYWQNLRDQRLSFFTNPKGSSSAYGLWRVSLPPSEIASFENLPSELESLSRLLEWHGALQWWWADAEQAKLLSLRVQAHGGHLKAYRPSSSPTEHPALGSLETQMSSIQVSLERRIQESFDPKGVFSARPLEA